MKSFSPYSVLLSILIIYCTSCKKASYLDAKPSQKLVVPETLKDFQELLDNDNIMNGSTFGGGGMLPTFGEAGSDDYYVTGLNGFTSEYVDLYKWDDQSALGSQAANEWTLSYRCAFYSNVVLEGLPKVTVASPSDQALYNNLKGSALFYRSHIFYWLGQIYAPAFDASTAAADLGIPLRLNGDLNETIQRASVQQTYDRIISDLKQAVPLLPLKPLYKTRPSKAAAFGLLARTYLSMRDYDNAMAYADSCLQLQNTLIDYNLYGAGSENPIPLFNDEVIFHSIIYNNQITLVSVAWVDSMLYKSYSDNDLRKALYFKKNATTNDYYFRGSYAQSFALFGGLAVDEIYLIRAECYARKNKITEALSDLNNLLQRRFKTGAFIPVTASGQSECLALVLTERRKELVFRGTRWTDLRRLNKEGANVSITRKLDGQLYILPPNSLKYTFLLPANVMAYNPGMKQNPR